MSQLTTQVKFEGLHRLRHFLLELQPLNRRRPDDLPEDRVCSCHLTTCTLNGCDPERDLGVFLEDVIIDSARPSVSSGTVVVSVSL